MPGAQVTGRSVSPPLRHCLLPGDEKLGSEEQVPSGTRAVPPAKDLRSTGRTSR